MSGLLEGPQCIEGDLNVVCFVWESREHNDMSNYMEEFLTFIDDNALVDIPLVGSRFTWSQGS